MFQLFSPNMLKTFEACPKKFHLKYVKKISMPTNDEMFELGKNIHALASYYLKKENIDKMELSLSEREKPIWEYLKSIPYFGYEVIDTEYNLSFKLNNSFFGGRLDGLVKNNDRLTSWIICKFCRILENDLSAKTIFCMLYLNSREKLEGRCNL